MTASDITHPAELESGITRIQRLRALFSFARRSNSGADASAGKLLTGPILPGYRKPRRTQRKGWRIFAYTTLFVLSFFYLAFFSILPIFLAVSALIPIIVILFLVIWVLPLSDAPPGRMLDFTFWGFFITLVVWPNYVAISIPGLPWITTLRLFGIPMAMLLLINASTSRPFRQQLNEMNATCPWIVRMVTAFAIVQVLSIPLALRPFDAINRVFSDSIAWTAMFFGALWQFRRKETIDRLIVVYCAMIVFLCIIAAIEARMARVIWQDVFPAAMIAQDEAVQNILRGAYRLTGEYRTIASSTTPLSFAELLALSIPFAFALLMRHFSVKALAAFIAFDIAVGYAISEAASRLGYVGSLMAHVGIAIYLAYNARKKNPDGIIAPATTVFAAAGVAAMIAAIAVSGRLRKAIFGGSEHQYSNESRSAQWALVPEKLIDNPITGFGAGQGGLKLGYYTPGGKLTIDSYAITVLMDYGILGALTYWPIIIGAIAYSIRNIRKLSEPYQTLNFAFLLFLAEYAVIRTVLSQDANQPLLFMTIAAVTATTYHGMKMGAGLPKK